MTKAEELVLKLIADGIPLGQQYDSEEGQPLEVAIKAMMLERATPEAREKFDFLFTNAKSAEREFSAFCDTLPRPVLKEWYRAASQKFFKEREP